MIQQLRSTSREIQRQASFRPPYCPNPCCKFHKRSGLRFYSRYGWKKIQRFPYKTRRYICTHCNKTFSFTFFFLDHRERAWGLNETIWSLFIDKSTKCSIARRIGHSERLVRDRLSKMARFSLLKHAYLTRNLPIGEKIVYDGLENFAFSQYDPNNINHAIGKDSLFTYDYNFSPMNRKGRMSPRQKAQKRRLERAFGPYPRDSIRTQTRRIIERLHKRCPSNVLRFLSDNHFQYRRAIQEDLASLKIMHTRVSSKIYRNYRNQLFAVNHLDMLTRHLLVPFGRETIAGSKHSIAMLEAFTLLATYKNYLRPKFLKRHKTDSTAKLRSPAMEVGVAQKILSFREFFQNRVTLRQVELSEDWRNLVERKDPHSRRFIIAYNGI